MGLCSAPLMGRDSAHTYSGAAPGIFVAVPAGGDPGLYRTGSTLDVVRVWNLIGHEEVDEALDAATHDKSTESSTENLGLIAERRGATAGLTLLTRLAL
jgi:hypothetical protein